MKALHFIEKNIDDIDLLFTDMTMPEMTGVELAKSCLRLKTDLPIILCTGFSESINQDQATRLGITTFLLKPVTKQDLALTVDTILHQT
jgi:YesN/AraC family two-component response regulator